MNLDAALRLMAVEPLPRRDWQLHTCQILKSAGLNIRNRNREVLAWKEVLASRGLRYSDGWLVCPMWLASGRRALGVTCKRLYFAGRDDIIDDRPEHIVVGDNRPESPLALEQLGSAWGLVQILKHGLGSSTTQVVLKGVNLDLGLAREVKIGSNICLSPPNTLNSLYKQYGFDMVPQNFTVNVCPVQGVSDQKADEFRKRLEQTGTKRHTKINVRRIANH